MLDTATKKRIDDCRNILVGKLPDPKAQIEQITIALIYKFMDDMDKEAIELGGKAKFFTGDYKTYGWDKLMNARVTAAEMLRLYSEAIQSMDKNKNIPQLFRDIFKNAFLPYRDPETLKLFLRTIGEFEYTHSEKLGDAFEYLLSVMGSQGDAGQFRTPRHIIDFLVAVVDPQKDDTILDPACGTAGFLISAFKHIKEKNNQNLTPAERKRLIQNFIGYDISPDMVRLSLVNLYLHGFSDPHIYEYDTLSSEERWKDNFDVILANPPFMSPKGGIRPHKKFSIDSNRSEVLFVDYIAEHLNPNGKAGIIVPEGVIFQSGTAYKALRKMLVEHYLYAVISLPAGIFNPYSGVKTSILLMDREVAKKSKEILFVKIDNDGFNLGAQRNAIKGGQLAEAIKSIHDFNSNGKHPAPGLAHVIRKSEIAKSGDYNLSGERYRSTLTISSNFPIHDLSEFTELVRGITFSKIDQLQESNKGSIKVATTKAAQEDGIVYDSLYNVPKSFLTSNEKVLIDGDILMSTANSLNLLGRVTYIENLKEQITFGAFMTLLRPNKNKIYPRLLFYLLKSEHAKSYYFANANTTTNISNLKFEDLNKFQIPLPPLSIQKEILAEIDGYQKIIDGAKMVVNNYKPKIEIDPKWELMKLGEISEFKNGLNFTKSSSGEIIKVFGVGNFKNHLIAPLTDLDKVQVEEKLNDNYLLQEGDILFVRSNGNVDLVGRSVVVPETKERISFSGFTIRCRLLSGIDPLYIGYLLKSDTFSDLMKSVGRGANIRNLSQGILNEIKIPIPSKKIQKEIVHRLNYEKALIETNKSLIEIFEKKIKDKIGSLWGDKESKKLNTLN